MDLLTRDSEMIECPHCKSPVRRGMIRCRDCGGVVAEDGSDFVLSNRAAAVRHCGRCGHPLEPGIDECPTCAGAMLDELLMGAGQTQAASPASADDHAAAGRAARYLPSADVA